MSKRVLLFVLAAALLFSAGCGGRQNEEEAEYVLYFLVSEEGSGHGSALGTEPYTGAEAWAGYESEDQDQPNPGELMQALVEGPKTAGLASPFPKGVSFQWWDWDPEQPGNLRVCLSEQYNGLTDISLTLADYCIVLTLSQLEKVESVEIITTGHTANYRSHQLLLPEEVVLSDEAAG